MISHVEYIDLNRLQEDRNRCAHPSMTSDGEIFNPSAELSRVHIRSAVEHLLQYPPAQGKYALDSLINEIDSEYFPTELSKAVTALEKSPLYKARESLIRNFTIILLKKLVNDVTSHKEISKVVTALNAIEHIHRRVYMDTLDKKLSSIVRAINGDEIYRIIPVIERLSDSWSYFEDDIRNKIESYVEGLPKDRFDSVELFLTIKDLEKSANIRLNKATRVELEEALFSTLPSGVGDRVVELFVESRNFDQANSFASTVSAYALDYSLEQVEKIIKACGDNDQIQYSYHIGSVIGSLRKNEQVGEEQFEAWLVEAELNNYCKKNNDDEN